MKASNIISINCGGKIFQTTTDTISKCEMLTAQYNNISEEETLFLDKDPKIFRYVLQIMRGDLEFKDAPSHIKKRLYSMMEYLLMHDYIKNEIFFQVDPDSYRFKRNKTIAVVSRHNYRAEFGIRVWEGDALEKIKIVLNKHEEISRLHASIYFEDKEILSEEYLVVDQICTIYANIEFLKPCYDLSLRYEVKMKNYDNSDGYCRDRITIYS